MFESLVDLTIANAHYAHYVFFILLLVAGVGLPFSEDLIFLLSGFLASTVIPENTWTLLIFVFLGAYISDCEAYWIGRYFGPKLWTGHKLEGKQERMGRLSLFYQNYGVWALLIGRCIPFGVRNCFIVLAGIGGMPFAKFLIVDGIACTLTTGCLFYLAYSFGQNFQTMQSMLYSANLILFLSFVIFVVAMVSIRKYRESSQSLLPPG